MSELMQQINKLFSTSKKAIIESGLFWKFAIFSAKCLHKQHSKLIIVK